MYDYLIVGAGFFGSVFAYQAKQDGKSCLVIDKRTHIGGNSYTKNMEGINVHYYGPHIFHTNSDKIWEFVNKFTEFKQFTYSPVANFKGELYSLPFNMWTFHQLWNTTTPQDALNKIEETSIHCESPTNIEEYAISQLGTDVYEKLIYGYTKKQWMREPRDLPSFIIKRLPFRLTYDNSYFNDKYCGIPVGGYTKIFEELLKGVEVKCGVNYFENKDEWNKKAHKVVYTGKIDEFFDYKHGELEYRTLDFQHNVMDLENYQGSPVINWTGDEVPWTRTIEHKHFEKSNSPKTVVTYETPVKCNKNSIPYYPVNDEVNNERYHQYNKEKAAFPNFIFGGRLASYKYYDMDQVIASALSTYKKMH
tara:strand:- start:18681 stop:19769 length:1089 start_codon:yes stop_codon:yes gene_type:complete